MTNNSDKLEYLTVDSVDWSTGYKRPRMSLEERRAKHRVIQRRFISRKRERIQKLRDSVRRHTLQLMVLQKMQEAARLNEENQTMLWFQDPPFVSATELPPNADEDVTLETALGPFQTLDWGCFAPECAA